MIEQDSANPWLSIPAADYEGHMGSAAVGQLQYLGQVFSDVLHEHQPRRLAVLGCATGNGFECIDPATVERVVGIDLQPDYLKILRERHAARLPMLELHCADLLRLTLADANFDLIFAGLFFEYLEPTAALNHIKGWLKPRGILAVVLQLPSDKGPVTETPYVSLKRLAPIMRLVDPAQFERIAVGIGFHPLPARTDTLPGGKRFYAAACRAP